MESVIRQLASGAGVRVLDIGRQEFISASDAFAFVEKCLAERRRLVGIEGFHVVDGGVEPDLDAIADLSRVYEAERSAHEARVFLTGLHDPNLVFSFTVAHERDP